MSDVVKFKVRARLLEQMGEQLIKSESIALMELIKNAYDADASNCKISMLNITSIEEGAIIIEDDGSGMSYEILRDVWLDIGTSNKSDIKKSEQKRSPKYHRLPLGEKGIGRFGVHRLGREIEIITRAEGQPECRLFINWDAIRQSKYIEDFPITLEKTSTNVFVNSTGTRISIRRLKTDWTRGTVRECARAILSLNSPFDSISSFRVNLFLQPDSDWLDGLVQYEDIRDFKLYSFEAILKGEKIANFNYEFTPFPSMNKIEGRILGVEYLVSRALDNLTKAENRQEKSINLAEENIGTVIFKGIVFDLDTHILNLATLTDKKGLKDYLSLNGGVRVFRDKVRIWDYGEPENDWLEMETRRINVPTLRISKRLIIGAVYLKGSDSSGLVEKANREGFMDNHAYQLLKDACRSVLEKVEICRREDKEKLRKIYGTKAVDVPVIASLAEAKTVIQKHIKDKDVARKINRCLDRIENNYDQITNSLIRSAGAGLNLIVVIHQMEKILKNITSGLKQQIPLPRIEAQVNDLSRLVEGYSILVKKSEIKPRNIKGIIEKALFNLNFRLETHKINLEAAFRQCFEHLDCFCSESHVVNAIMNLVDNSIWWMNSAGKTDKSIFIDISAELKGFVVIVVADTGPGFTVSKDLLGQAFVTAKPDGIGMGIGLHLTTLLMESLGGKILYPDFGDFSVPGRYKNGAIVALAFRKYQEV